MIKEYQMNKIQQEIQENSSIDWKKIKDILVGIDASLVVIINELPDGVAKKILQGIDKVILVLISAM
jgi:uncharacterized protein YpuA (DUF1002 family)